MLGSEIPYHNWYRLRTSSRLQHDIGNDLCPCSRYLGRIWRVLFETHMSVAQNDILHSQTQRHRERERERETERERGEGERKTGREGRKREREGEREREGRGREREIETPITSVDCLHIPMVHCLGLKASGALHIPKLSVGVLV